MLLLINGCIPQILSDGITKIGSAKQNYLLFPVESKTESIGNGLVNYTVQIGIENTSAQNTWTYIFLGDLNLKTKEGYTFHHGNNAQVNNNLDVFKGCLLPPSFRKKSDSYTFEIGETLHPSEIQFSEYGSISLNTSKTIFFPTSKPESSFIEFPYSVDSSEGKLTFVGNPKLDCSDGGCKLGIDIEFYNSNPAQKYSPCVFLVVFDKRGVCSTDQRVNCGIAETGPLQTSHSTIWVNIDETLGEEFHKDGFWAEDLAISQMKDALHGAKIHATINKDQFDVIFNLKIP
jgi:hypothetical protein